MKKLLLILSFFIATILNAQVVVVNIPGTDNVTGKKVHCELMCMKFTAEGSVMSVVYKVTYFESNNTTPAVAPGTSERQKKSIASFTAEYVIGDKIILSTTKVYSPLVDNSEVPIPNAILLSAYLKTKLINAYPSVAGSSPLSDVIKGIFVEILNIQLANGEIL